MPARYQTTALAGYQFEELDFRLRQLGDILALNQSLRIALDKKFGNEAGNVLHYQSSIANRATGRQPIATGFVFDIGPEHPRCID